MGKTIHFCVSCDQTFQERFTFCPKCAGKLTIYDLVPVRDPSVSGPESTSEQVETETPRSVPFVAEQGHLTARPSAPTFLGLLDDPEASEGPEDTAGKYGGIGRLAYFAGLVGSIIASVILQIVLVPMEIDPRVVVFPQLIVAWILAVFRLKNIGASKWWSLLAFVPLANVWIVYRCLAQQEGYEEINSLDEAGRTVRWIYIVFVAVFMTSALWFLASSTPFEVKPVSR